MAPIIYHGDIQIDDFINAIFANFNRGNLRVQEIGQNNFKALQIATIPGSNSGGQTSLSISFQNVPDGVSVEVGKQAMLGVAASFGFTALATLLNPVNLINRLDDLAQDISSVQLSDEVIKVLDQTARTLNASFDLSDRFKKNICEYCGTPNTLEEIHCIACGAPLGSSRPVACLHCGYILNPDEKICPNCHNPR